MSADAEFNGVCQFLSAVVICSLIGCVYVLVMRCIQLLAMVLGCVYVLVIRCIQHLAMVLRSLQRWKCHTVLRSTSMRPIRSAQVTLFNMRQSYCARYSYRLDVCPSVCLSVRHMLVLCRNCSTCHQTVLTVW